MTIGIAVVTSDAVLLVADGRRSDAFKVHTDEAEKIVAINDKLAVICFGTEIGTDGALACLRGPGLRARDAKGIGEHLEGCVFAGGSHVLSLVSEEQRKTLVTLKVGLVAGGVADDGYFLAGSLYGSLMGRPESALMLGQTGQLQRIILGGEAGGAQKHFDQQLETILAGGITDSRTLLPMLLHAAESTVRYVERVDNTVGGRIQYRILRSGEHPETGFR